MAYNNNGPGGYYQMQDQQPYAQPPQQQYQQPYGYPPPQQPYPQQNYQQQPPPQQQPYPPQQQSYPPPQDAYPPQYTGPPKQNLQGAGDKTFDQVFQVPKPKWNDLWAGILFAVFVLGFAAVSGISLYGYTSNKGSSGNGIYDGRNGGTINTRAIICLIICVAFSFVISVLYIWLVRTFTKAIIWITGILNILFGLATAIAMIINKQYVGGIIFLVFVVFLVICFISWIPRIPFSVLMLQTATDVARRYGHVWMVSLLGGLVTAAFFMWYVVTVMAVYVRFQSTPGNSTCTQQGGCTNGTVIGLIVFCSFTAYWVTEWIKNTVHTTISGVYGSWYFCVNSFPKDVTRAALKRALTYSYGSICLGSLIVALINLLRQICQAAQSQAAGDGNIVGMILYCILGCIISLLQWVVEFVNRYAFSHIALYGKPYFAAAKDTWKMIKDRGIDALVNECLIGPVFGFGALFVAYASALVSFAFLRITDPNNYGSYFAPVLAVAFLVGLQTCNIFTTPLSSGIDTIFVAAGWDPEVMMRDHPELYANMVRVFPHVQQAIHA